MVEARETTSTDRDGWAGPPDDAERGVSRLDSGSRFRFEPAGCGDSVAGDVGAGVLFAAQHNIPADFLEQRKEFAGCGSEIELFTCDTQAVCEHCGFVVYNDTLSCVQWCKYARKCVGDEMYERMMEIARRQKEEAAAARKAKQEAQHAEKNY